MGGLVRGSVLRALVAEAHRIDSGEQVLASAQKHGGDHEVDLVDQPGGEVLANGGDSPAESDVLALGPFIRAQRAADDAAATTARRAGTANARSPSSGEGFLSGGRPAPSV